MAEDVVQPQSDTQDTADLLLQAGEARTRLEGNLRRIQRWRDEVPTVAGQLRGDADVLLTLAKQIGQWAEPADAQRTALAIIYAQIIGEVFGDALQRVAERLSQTSLDTTLADLEDSIKRANSS